LKATKSLFAANLNMSNVLANLHNIVESSDSILSAAAVKKQKEAELK